MTATVQEFHDSLLAAHRSMLDEYVRAAGEAGVTALGEALWGSPFHEVVLARVAATRPDLVVKHTEYHGRPSGRCSPGRTGTWCATARYRCCW